MCGNNEAGILPGPCGTEGVHASGLFGVTRVIDVSGKEEAPTIPTIGVVEKDKFPSPSGKPKDDWFTPRDCVVVEPGGK